MAADLQEEFKVDGTQLGALSSAYFWPYLCVQFVLGYLFQRFGVDAVVGVAMVVATAGSLVFAIADTLAVAVIGRCLVGLGVGAAWLGVVTVAQGQPFAAAGLSTTVMGVGMMFGLTGALIAQTPLTLAIQAAGFRPVLLWASVAPAVIAVAFLGRVLPCFSCQRGGRDDAASNADGDAAGSSAAPGGHSGASPSEIADRKSPLLHGTSAAAPEPRYDGASAPPLSPAAPDAAKATVWAAFGAALTAPVTPALAVYGFGIVGPLLAFASLWATPFLEDVYGLDKPTAAGFVSAFLVGWGVGGPIVGRVVDALGGGVQGAKWVLLLCPAIGAATLTPVLMLRLPDALAVILLLLSGATTCIPVVFAYVKEAVEDPAGKATAAAIVNASMILAGAALQPAIGASLDAAAGDRVVTLPGGRRVYPADAYRVALLWLPACSLLCLAAISFSWLCLNHGRPRHAAPKPEEASR